MNWINHFNLTVTTTVRTRKKKRLHIIKCIFNDLPIFFFIAYDCVLPEFDFDKSSCPTYGSTYNFVLFDVDRLHCAAADGGIVVVVVVVV